jgi:hypothetical protein
MPLLRDIRHYEVTSGALIAEIAAHALQAGITPDLYVERVLQRLMDLHCLGPEQIGGLVAMDEQFQGRR